MLDLLRYSVLICMLFSLCQTASAYSSAKLERYGIYVDPYKGTLTLPPYPNAILNFDSAPYLQATKLDGSHTERFDLKKRNNTYYLKVNGRDYQIYIQPEMMYPQPQFQPLPPAPFQHPRQFQPYGPQPIGHAMPPPPPPPPQNLHTLVTPYPPQQPDPMQEALHASQQERGYLAALNREKDAALQQLQDRSRDIALKNKEKTRKLEEQIKQLEKKHQEDTARLQEQIEKQDKEVTAEKASHKEIVSQLKQEKEKAVEDAKKSANTLSTEVAIWKGKSEQQTKALQNERQRFAIDRQQIISSNKASARRMQQQLEQQDRKAAQLLLEKENAEKQARAFDQELQHEKSRSKKLETALAIAQQPPLESVTPKTEHKAVQTRTVARRDRTTQTDQQELIEPPVIQEADTMSTSEQPGSSSPKKAKRKKARKKTTPLQEPHSDSKPPAPQPDQKAIYDKLYQQLDREIKLAMARKVRLLRRNSQISNLYPTRQLEGHLKQLLTFPADDAEALRVVEKFCDQLMEQGESQLDNMEYISATVTLGYLIRLIQQFPSLLKTHSPLMMMTAAFDIEEQTGEPLPLNVDGSVDMVKRVLKTHHQTLSPLVTDQLPDKIERQEDIFPVLNAMLYALVIDNFALLDEAASLIRESKETFTELLTRCCYGSDTRLHQQQVRFIFHHITYIQKLALQTFVNMRLKVIPALAADHQLQLMNTIEVIADAAENNLKAFKEGERHSTSKFPITHVSKQLVITRGERWITLLSLLASELPSQAPQTEPQAPDRAAIAVHELMQELVRVNQHTQDILPEQLDPDMNLQILGLQVNYIPGIGLNLFDAVAKGLQEELDEPSSPMTLLMQLLTHAIAVLPPQQALTEMHQLGLQMPDDTELTVANNALIAIANKAGIQFKEFTLPNELPELLAQILKLPILVVATSPHRASSRPDVMKYSPAAPPEAMNYEQLETFLQVDHTVLILGFYEGHAQEGNHWFHIARRRRTPLPPSTDDLRGVDHGDTSPPPPSEKIDQKPEMGEGAMALPYNTQLHHDPLLQSGKHW